MAYKLDMKIKQYRHLSIFLAIYWNLYGNMVNLGHFFHGKSFVWVQIILFRLKTIKFHPPKNKDDSFTISICLPINIFLSHPPKVWKKTKGSQVSAYVMMTTTCRELGHISPGKKTSRELSLTHNLWRGDLENLHNGWKYEKLCPTSLKKASNEKVASKTKIQGV